MIDLEKYIEDIMVTFPDVNQSHRRMMQKVGYHQQKKIDKLENDNKILNDCINQAEETVREYENLEAKLTEAVEVIEEMEPELVSMHCPAWRRQRDFLEKLKELEGGNG